MNPNDYLNEPDTDSLRASRHRFRHGERPPASTAGEVFLYMFAAAVVVVVGTLLSDTAREAVNFCKQMLNAWNA